MRTAISWTTRKGWADMVALAPGLELGQASLRVAVGAVVFVGLVLRLVGRPEPSAELSYMVWLMAGFVTIGVAITLWTLASPQVSPARRILGIVADNAATTYFLLLMGEAGAVVVWIYLFVAFGNAFRYGPRYVRISQVAAILGFSLVLYFSDFWSQHIVIGVGLLVGLLVLPLYVGLMFEILNRARLNAEQALRECREQKESLSRPTAF